MSWSGEAMQRQRDAERAAFVRGFEAGRDAASALRAGMMAEAKCEVDCPCRMAVDEYERRIRALVAPEGA